MTNAHWNSFLVLLFLGFKILSIFNPRESFHIPGLCRQLCAFGWAESSRRGGEAGSTRPTHSWRWSPFYAFHNSPILVTKSCHYLSQNGLNQASNSMKMVKNSPGIEPLNKKADVYQLPAPPFGFILFISVRVWAARVWWLNWNPEAPWRKSKEPPISQPRDENRHVHMCCTELHKQQHISGFQSM